MKVEYKYDDGSKIFFTSDTHFCHENIIRFCNRPFSDATEMNRTIIENWNRVVPEDGLVFHLGDFAFTNFKTISYIREQLNGNIFLILGNHDLKQVNRVSDYTKVFQHVTFQMYIEIEGRKVWLNHYPFLCYAGTYRNEKDLVYQLFGHVHSKPEMCDEGKDLSRLSMLFPTQYDVGCDRNNFTPVSWYEANKIIQEQIQKSKENGNTSIS